MGSLMAFTAQQATGLTGLSAAQLKYWDRTGFFRPHIVVMGRRTFARIYSFRDIVGLRAISVLRNEHHVPLQELRKVGAWLAERHDQPWSTLRFAIANRRVVFFDPATGVAVEPRGAGQEVLTIALERIVTDVDRRSMALRDRSADRGKVVRNRYVLRNAPVLAGTRIRTAAIWHYAEAGFSTEAILQEYPRLTADDVTAAVDFERTQRAA